MEIRIERTTAPKAKPADETALGFGNLFTDHMFVMDYTEGKGWHDARIVPYAPLVLDPAALVFHYAQECFEGMKAYRRADGKVQLFRPEKNAARMQSTHQRLCIPEIPVEDFVQAVRALVQVDEAWVPHTDGTSLYLRPFTIATEAVLGVKASARYQFIVIASPSGAYYAEGINPVRIYVEDEYVRAAPGGTGYITDVGMCGPLQSVIGVVPAQAIEKQRCHTPVRFSVAEGACGLNAVLFTLNDADGHCTAVRQILLP